MNKFLITCSALCLAFNAFAQDEIINADVQKSFEQTQAAMQKSVAQIDAEMQKMMPVVAESMSQMMQEVFKTLPPLMKSIEENQVLSKAADQLSQEIDSQIKETGFTVKTSAQTPESEDNFMISGSKNDNGKKLDFSFNQNDERLDELQKAIAAKTSPENGTDFSLTDLKNQKLKGKDFKLEFIDGRSYLVYDDGDTYCYITGIAENNVVIRVLTSGEDAPARARNFIKNSRRRF